MSHPHLKTVVVVCAAVLVCSAAAQRPTPQQHARLGWEALDAGRASEAAAAFAEALRDAPREPSVLLGAGIAAQQLGRTDAARSLLSDALKYDRKLTAASLLLGEILYRATDLQGALAVYEQALAHAPGHPLLTKKLELWRKEAALHDSFNQKLGDHFTVLFEGPPETELARKAVEILEGAYARIGGALYTYPADVITVVLYTREQFRDVTQSPSWAGGLFDGRIRVPVQGAMKDLAQLERVLAHEFTHALVRSVAPRGVPQWFNEGLALYFEGSQPAARRQLLETAGAAAPPLSALEGSFGGLAPRAAQLAYAQSGEAVRKLLEEAGPAAVAGMLTDIGRGIPFADAFARHTHESYEDFQRRMLTHPAMEMAFPIAECVSSC